MGKNGVPVLPDIRSLIKAGIDPKSGLPTRMRDEIPSLIRDAFRKALRIKDEQNAVMRYTWGNLPKNIDGELIERMLYYRGQLAFGYVPEADEFYMLPYTLCGDAGKGIGLDGYGRFNYIKLIPWAGDGIKNDTRTLSMVLSGKIFNVVYDVLEGAPEIKDIEDSAVILKDYTSQLSETNVPRREINDPVLTLESACFAYANTAMINATGVEGLRVNSEEEKGDAKELNKSIEYAALNGERAIPIVGTIDQQELTGGKTTTTDEFMVIAQAIDNFRLSLYGIENGGLYQKKTYVNDSQTQMNAGNTSDVYHNGLAIRQKFCNIVNSIWGLGIYCEASEFHSAVDIDGDGTLDNRKDQSGAGNDVPPGEGGEEDV